MRLFKRAASAGAVVGIVALSLVVSAAPAQAWQTPVLDPAPPRISAPEPTTFKPGTTALTPKFLLKKIPILGLALDLDGMVTDWLQGVTGNTANPTLGCVGTSGVFSSGACSDSTAKPATAPNNGLVVPDTLWGAITGKGLNMLGTEAAPDNWTVIQDKPKFDVPANGAANFVSLSWSGVKGAVCVRNPQWGNCASPLEDSMSSLYSQAPIFAECAVNGGTTGIWTGTSNTSKTTGYAFNGHTVAARDIQVCGPGQTVNWVKIKSGGPTNPYPGDCCFGSWFFPTVAGGMWINPNKDVYKDTTITSNLTCKNGSGGSVTVSKTSAPGTGIVPTVQCPAGYLPDSGNTSVGTSFLDAPKKVEEWQITPETRETYPDCIGWQSAGCIMRVELDGVDCSPGNPACFDWAEIQRLQPSRVKCKWGTYTIDISNCLPLRNGYQSESGISAAPSQAPGTAPLGRDVFGRPVQPNADPLAPPQWQPDYGTPTNPAPTTGGTTFPDSGPNPFPPTNPNPVPPGEPQPLPPATPSGSANCDSPTWSWNPVDWVYSPIVCAAIDLVMPKLDVPARVNELGEIAGTKAPISWMSPDMVGPSGAGCPNWVINLPGFSKNVVCDSSFTAAIVGSRGPLFGLVAGAMVWPLFRSLWYAAIPILRVTPSSSK